MAVSRQPPTKKMMNRANVPRNNSYPWDIRFQSLVVTNYWMHTMIVLIGGTTSNTSNIIGEHLNILP